mgnify:CR=1 FL=1
MVEEIRNGGTLSGAAAKHPEAFPNYYMGILGSAELTGRLDETLENLAGYLERELETRAKVVSSLSYPGVVMVLAVFTVAVLAGYVLPQFKPLFEELDADLPFMTRALLFVATLFSTLWYIPFSIGGLFTAFMVWMMKSESGRTFKDHLVLKIPVVRGIVEYAILERFCRILGAMVRAGVPLPDAMKTTTDATSNSVYRERLAEAQLEMMEGGGFARPLANTELFPGAAHLNVIRSWAGVIEMTPDGRPVIDRRYPLDDTHAALDRLASGAQFGKLAFLARLQDHRSFEYFDNRLTQEVIHVVAHESLDKWP